MAKMWMEFVMLNFNACMRIRLTSGSLRPLILLFNLHRCEMLEKKRVQQLKKKTRKVIMFFLDFEKKPSKIT